MKKLILATAIAAACVTGFAHAEDAAPEAAPLPDNQVAFNIGVVNDYRFRGISQSRLDPAVQGGIDYTNNPTGLYLGTWASTIKWIKDGVNASAPGTGKGSAEIDVYGGKKGDIGGGFTYDVGGLYYYYPDNNYSSVGNKNANTFELYGQIGYGVGYFKYSQALTNAFGTVDSKNSKYYDLGANIEGPYGTTFALHVGHQTITGASGGLPNSRYSYTDWKVGVSKTFEELAGITLGLAYIGTDATDGSYVTPDGKNNGRNGVVVSLLKTF